MKKNLISLGVAASLVFAATPLFAQGSSGYPGGGYPGGGYPGGGGGYPGGGGGYPGAGAYPGGGGASTQVVTTTDTTTEPTGTLPKTGGDPLSVMAAGSLLMTLGYGVRRKFRAA
jgi:LPXTG-motif cell wall-anchored protein